MKKRPFVPFTLPITEYLNMQLLMFPITEVYSKIATYNEKLNATKVEHTHLLELFSLKQD